jgi:hypothetical protein
MQAVTHLKAPISQRHSNEHLLKDFLTHKCTNIISGVTLHFDSLQTNLMNDHECENGFYR